MSLSEKESAKRRRDSESSSLKDTDAEVEAVFKEWEERKRVLLIEKKKKKRRKKTKTPSQNDDENVYENWYKDWKDEQLPVVPLQSITNAVRLLRREKPRPSVFDVKTQKLCKGNSMCITSFDSPICLLVAIQKCILTRNWIKLAEFLHILVRQRKSWIYNTYIKQVSSFIIKHISLKTNFLDVSAHYQNAPC